MTHPRRVLLAVALVVTAGAACSGGADDSRPTTPPVTFAVGPAASTDDGSETTLGGATTLAVSTETVLPQRFMKGMNIPWGNFGADLGCTADTTWFDTALPEIAATGVDTVRWWIHADGRCTPDFDTDDVPSPLDAMEMAQMQEIFDKIAANGMQVIPVLFSQHVIQTVNPAFPFGYHDRFVSDPAKRRVYVDTVLPPILALGESHPAVIAWEVMNEPELAVKGIGRSDEGEMQPKAVIQAFVGEIAAAIHRGGNKPVTVGSYRPRYVEANDSDNVDSQWWSDVALFDVTGDPDATIDIFQVHYYEYMKDDSPWDINLPQPRYSEGKPVIVGEFPLDLDRGVGETILELHAMGYAGAFPWAYNEPNCCGSWTEYQPEIAAAYNALG